MDFKLIENLSQKQIEIYYENMIFDNDFLSAGHILYSYVACMANRNSGSNKYVENAVSCTSGAVGMYRTNSAGNYACYVICKTGGCYEYITRCDNK